MEGEREGGALHYMECVPLIPDNTPYLIIVLGCTGQCHNALTT